MWIPEYKDPLLKDRAGNWREWQAGRNFVLVAESQHQTGMWTPGAHCSSSWGRGRAFGYKLDSLVSISGKGRGPWRLAPHLFIPPDPGQTTELQPPASRAG